MKENPNIAGVVFKFTYGIVWVPVLIQEKITLKSLKVSTSSYMTKQEFSYFNCWALLQ